MTTHVQQTLPFPWQGGYQCSLPLLIQQELDIYIRKPTETHYAFLCLLSCLTCFMKCLYLLCEHETVSYPVLNCSLNLLSVHLHRNLSEVGIKNSVLCLLLLLHYSVYYLQHSCTAWLMNLYRTYLATDITERNQQKMAFMHSFDIAFAYRNQSLIPFVVVLLCFMNALMIYLAASYAIEYIVYRYRVEEAKTHHLFRLDLCIMKLISYPIIANYYTN